MEAHTKIKIGKATEVDGIIVEFLKNGGEGLKVK